MELLLISELTLKTVDPIMLSSFQRNTKKSSLKLYDFRFLGHVCFVNKNETKIKLMSRNRA